MTKNIGLLLSAEPSAGGVYQYSLSVIHALNLLRPEQFNLRCFFFDERWREVIPDRFEKVLIKRTFLNRAIVYVIKGIFHSSSFFQFSGHFSDTVMAINASDCDVVIYPGQDDAAYQTNKRSVATIHDLMHRYESQFDEYKGRECSRRDAHYLATCQYADLILVDSKVSKQHVCESYGVDGDRVEILPFVPPIYLLKSNLIDVRKKYSLPEDFLFYPAQFWEHKNHIGLLQAIRIAKDTGLQINLVLVGSEKNYLKKVLSTISDLCLSENVFILGYVSNDDLYSLYKSAIAMTFVSLIGPTNIPPMEALITGCPLICSNAYAMPEQVGPAALLVDPKDPSDMAEKIATIWEDAELRQRMRNLGFEQVRRYDVDDFSRLLCSHVTRLATPSG